MLKWIKKKIFGKEEAEEKLEEETAQEEIEAAEELEESEVPQTEVEEARPEKPEEKEEPIQEEIELAEEVEESEIPQAEAEEARSEKLEEKEEPIQEEVGLVEELEESEVSQAEAEEARSEKPEEKEEPRPEKPEEKEKPIQEEIEAAEEVEELEVSQAEAEEARPEKLEEKEEPIQEEVELAEEVEELEVSQAEVEELGPEKLEEKEEPIQEEIEAAEEVEESEVSQTEAEEPRSEKPEEKEESLEEEVEETGKKLGFFEKLKQGLTKTRDNLTEQISSVIKSYQKVDEELFEDLEEILITADVGIETTMDLIDNLRDRVKEEKVNEPEEVMGLLKSEIEKIMLRDDLDHEMKLDPAPAVILVVGVNGVGKTTTIGKMAARYKKEGKKVLIAAGDTFRAAAIEQLEEWGNRAGVDIISHSEGADPAAVIYDGIQAAKARNVDLLICDTAGRLHNKENLMNELNKIFRVLERDYGEASKEVLLVLDATTGQNAMSQAKQFKEVANITGIALTKLDGTAKGGVVIALQSELGVPIKFIGVGEGIDDLQVFDAGNFIEAIFSK